MSVDKYITRSYESDNPPRTVAFLNTVETLDAARALLYFCQVGNVSRAKLLGDELIERIDNVELVPDYFDQTNDDPHTVSMANRIYLSSVFTGYALTVAANFLAPVVPNVSTDWDTKINVIRDSIVTKLGSATLLKESTSETAYLKTNIYGFYFLHAQYVYTGDNTYKNLADTLSANIIDTFYRNDVFYARLLSGNANPEPDDFHVNYQILGACLLFDIGKLLECIKLNDYIVGNYSSNDPVSGMYGLTSYPLDLYPTNYGKVRYDMVLLLCRLASKLGQQSFTTSVINDLLSILTSNGGLIQANYENPDEIPYAETSYSEGAYSLPHVGTTSYLVLCKDNNSIFLNVSPNSSSNLFIFDDGSERINVGDILDDDTPNNDNIVIDDDSN